jgi:hypothetical protein
MKPKRITFVESPFTHPTKSREDCVRYALWACVDATQRGECVFASHLFYTQFLPEDRLCREWGLVCRDMLAKATVAQIARYVDIGQTPGMFRDIDCTAEVVTRKLEGAAREGWLAGTWPDGSLRPVVW